MTRCSLSPGRMGRLWKALLVEWRKKLGWFLLMLAGAYLQENLDGVDCYTNGLLKKTSLCIGQALSV